MNDPRPIFALGRRLFGPVLAPCVLLSCDSETLYLGPVATLSSPLADAAAIVEPANATPLPLVVDDHYTPSGIVMDAETQGVLEVQIDGCLTRSAAPVEGSHCYRVSYVPEPPPPELYGTSSWAAVFFQYPENNWGDATGLPIASGATRVAFSAVGELGGEQVTFFVGGIDDPALEHHDVIDEATLVELTTQWQEYSIDLSQTRYDYVISAFGFRVSKLLTEADLNAPAPIVFYIDSIRWE